MTEQQTPQFLKETTQAQEILIHSPTDLTTGFVEQKRNGTFSVQCYVTPNENKHPNADEVLVWTNKDIVVVTVLDGVSGRDHSLASDSALLVHTAMEHIEKQQSLLNKNPEDIIDALTQTLVSIDFEGLEGGINGTIIAVNTQTKKYALLSIGNDDSHVEIGENSRSLRNIKPDNLSRYMFVPSEKHTRDALRKTIGKTTYTEPCILVGSDGIHMSDVDWIRAAATIPLPPGRDDKSLVVVNF